MTASTNHLPKPVGIWIRVSTEDQAAGESPEHHEARARMYAQAKDWHVVRVYDLSGVSGKSVVEHSECQAMLADIEAGRVKGLIFSKLARLARNTKQLLEFADYFQRHDADLISLKESIDTSTPAGRFFYTMIAAMAQWEREEIADRVKESVKIRAKLGKPTGGAAPFGYRWEDKQLVIDETEAPIRKLMFELFSEHKRLKTVARILNEAGHRTRRSAKFSSTSVKRLLEDPLAKGLRRANYTQSLGENQAWELKPESEWIYTEAPPIVSEELWDECNAILEKRKKGPKPARKPMYLFSGLVYCICGTKMYKPANMKKYYCRGCLNKIPTRDLELVFVEQLKSFFFDADEIAHHLERNDLVLEEKKQLLETKISEKQAVEREMDLTYRLYLEEQITSEGFGKRYGPLEERLSAINTSIPVLQGEIDALAVSHLSVAAVVSDAQTLYASWEHLTFDEKRTVITTIVERITIGDTTVDIDLAYIPTGTDLPPSSPNPPLSSPSSPQTVVKRERILRDTYPPPAAYREGFTSLPGLPLTASAASPFKGNHRLETETLMLLAMGLAPSLQQDHPLRERLLHRLQPVDVDAAG